MRPLEALEGFKGPYQGKRGAESCQDIALDEANQPGSSKPMIPGDGDKRVKTLGATRFPGLPC